MKEVIIVFIAAMCITSFVNGISSANAGEPSTSETVDEQSATVQDHDAVLEEPTLRGARATEAGAG